MAIPFQSGGPSHPLSENSWATQQGIVLSLVTVLSVISNGLVCCLLLSRKQHLTPSSRFVLSLCSSNFVVSLLVLPLAFVSAIRRQWDFGEVWCIASAFLWLLVTCATNLTLAAIALDRYFAIVRPMSYSVTGSKSTLIILSVWVAAVLLCTVPLLTNIRMNYQPLHTMCLIDWTDSVPYSSTFLGISFAFPALVLSVCYGCIFRIACSKYEKVHTLRTVSALVATTTSQRPYGRKPSWLAVVLHSPVKGFAVICAILGSYFLLWTPYALTVVFQLTRFPEMAPWQQRVALLGSLLALPSYPFVYGILNRSIRKSFVDQFLGGFKKLPNRPTTQQQGASSAVGLLDYTPPATNAWMATYHSTDLVESNKAQLYALCSQRKASDDSGRFSMQSDETVASKTTVVPIDNCYAKEDNYSS